MSTTKNTKTAKETTKETTQAVPVADEASQVDVQGTNTGDEGVNPENTTESNTVENAGGGTPNLPKEGGDVTGKGTKQPTFPMRVTMKNNTPSSRYFPELVLIGSTEIKAYSETEVLIRSQEIFDLLCSNLGALANANKWHGSPQKDRGIFLILEDGRFFPEAKEETLPEDKQEE